LVVLVMTCVANLLPPWAQASEIEEQLKAEYQNKVLTQRHFYQGSKLQFDSNGQVVGDATLGPWTVDAQINIKEIHLHERLLQLKGQRVFLFFDSTTNRMKNVIGITASDPLSKEFRQFGSKAWPKFEKSADVEVDLDLASTPKDEKEVASAINVIFLTPNDDLAEFVPESWKGFVLKQEGKSQALRTPASVYVYKVGRDMSPPRALQAPDPEYSEIARQAGFHGTTVLWLVVTPDGSAPYISVARPAGLGLDEKAVQAVSTWKFEPARKDGSPVAVQINVEVTFRLY
jgi:TonB family protein